MKKQIILIALIIVSILTAVTILNFIGFALTGKFSESINENPSYAFGYTLALVIQIVCIRYIYKKYKQ